MKYSHSLKALLSCKNQPALSPGKGQACAEGHQEAEQCVAFS